MTQRTKSRSIRKFRGIIVVALAVALALSANVAWAGHQLVNEGSATLKLEPTALAGNATGQVELQIATGNNGSQGEDGDQAPDGSGEPDGDGTTEPDGDDSDRPPDGDGFDHPDGRPESPPSPPLAPQNNPQSQRSGLHCTKDLAAGQSVVSGNIRIENLDNTENVEVFLVDEDGDRAISLGSPGNVNNSTLDGDLSATVDNVEDFDSVVVTRQSADGNDEGPSSEILFSAELLHDQ